MSISDWMKKPDKKSLDSQLFDKLEKIKGDTSPSIVALIGVLDEREIRRVAIRMSVPEHIAAAIIAGDSYLGTLRNEKLGLDSGAPMTELNVRAFNNVIANIYRLASWKKSLPDFNKWVARRHERWRAVQDIQEITQDIPLSLPDEKYAQFITELRKKIRAYKLEDHLGDDFIALLDEDIELTIIKTRMETIGSKIVGDILDDEFDYYGTTVEEEYIKNNCGILYSLLVWANATYIIRNRSIQGRMYEAEELGAVTKQENRERPYPDPTKIDGEDY